MNGGWFKYLKYDFVVGINCFHCSWEASDSSQIIAHCSTELVIVVDGKPTLIQRELIFYMLLVFT